MHTEIVLLQDQGVAGCGITIAHGVAHYGLGVALSEAFDRMEMSVFSEFLVCWRDELRTVLTLDPDNHLGQGHPEIASQVLETFPDYEDLKRYLSPLTVFSGIRVSPSCIYEANATQPCMRLIATLCERYFGFGWEATLAVMRGTIWEGAAIRLMCKVGIADNACLFLARGD